MSKKVYDPTYHRDQNPEEFEVVELVPSDKITV